MNYFDKVFNEYAEKNQAFFAFSNVQVKEHVSLEEFQANFVSGGMGMYLHRDIVQEFYERLDEEDKKEKASLPILELEFLGFNCYDYPTFREVNTGKYYYDTDYNYPKNPVGSLAWGETFNSEPYSHVNNTFDIVNV